jgi:hypothetical protein
MMPIEPSVARMLTSKVWLDDERVAVIFAGMQHRRRHGKVGETT